MANSVWATRTPAVSKSARWATTCRRSTSAPADGHRHRGRHRTHLCAPRQPHGEVLGIDLSGQLGLGDTTDRGDGPGEMGDNLPAVDLGTGRTATAIAAGGYHTCALLDDGTVKCWGRQRRPARLGDTEITGDAPARWATACPPSTSAPGAPPPRSPPASRTPARSSTTAPSSAGEPTPRPARPGRHRPPRRQPGEMGDALPAIDLGTGRTATAISAGIAHTCALLDDGTVKCWGATTSASSAWATPSTAATSPARWATRCPPSTSAPAARHRRGRRQQSHVRRPRRSTTSSAGAQQLRPARPGRHLAGRQRRRDGRRPRRRRPRHRTHGHGRRAPAERSHLRAPRQRAVKCWGRNAGASSARPSRQHGDAAGEMGDSLPAVDLGTGRRHRRRDRSRRTPAPSSTTARSSAGATTPGQLGLGDTTTAATAPARWATTSPPSTSAPAAPPRRSPPAARHTCALLDNGA